MTISGKNEKKQERGFLRLDFARIDENGTGTVGKIRKSMDILSCNICALCVQVFCRFYGVNFCRDCFEKINACKEFYWKNTKLCWVCSSVFSGTYFYSRRIVSLILKLDFGRGGTRG